MLRIQSAAAAAGVVGLGMLAAHASAATLFTTSADFATFTAQPGFAVAASTAFDADGQTLNGIGNYTVGTSAGGSLQVTRSASTAYAGIAFSNQDEAGNQAFLTAVAPGSVATTYPPPNFNQVPGATAQYSGNLYLTYTVPTNNGGNYFDVGVIFNYTGNFGQFGQTSSTSAIVNGQTVVTATIPYTINAAAGLSYFQLGLLYNSNYNATTPFFVDSISTTPPAAAPEPTTLAALAVGGLLLRRRRA